MEKKKNKKENNNKISLWSLLILIVVVVIIIVICFSLSKDSKENDVQNDINIDNNINNESLLDNNSNQSNNKTVKNLEEDGKNDDSAVKVLEEKVGDINVDQYTIEKEKLPSDEEMKK